MRISDKLKAGNVLRYTPEQHHCREGTALVDEDGRAFDTYWRGYSDRHMLTRADPRTKRSYTVDVLNAVRRVLAREESKDGDA